MTEQRIVWAACADCGRPIFRHYAWSHEGGTPDQDHEATPVDTHDAPVTRTGAKAGRRLTINGTSILPAAQHHLQGD